MSQLHELLAVENDLKTLFGKIHAETVSVMGKPDLFKGYEKTLSITKSGVDTATKDAVEAAGSDVKVLVTTVDTRLAYDGDFFAKRADHALQKDRTNQTANGDIIIDGRTIATNLPATFLLTLESLLVEKRKQYAAAPTLQAGKEWVSDEAAGIGIFKTQNPDKVTKTEKAFKSQILVAPTDKHPAQIEKWQEDVVIGIFTTQEKSGMWTSARKSEVLARCDKMIQAVKEARSRANQATVIQGQVGNTVLAFIEAKEVTA